MFFYIQKQYSENFANVNTVEDTDKIKNILFVEREILCEWKLRANYKPLFSVFLDASLMKD